MKRSFPSILSALAVVLLLAGITGPLTGCVGQKARDGVGTRAIALADDGVIADMARGVALLEAADADDSFNDAQALSNVNTFAAAVETGDRWQMATVALPLWGIVSGYAEDGFALDIANGDLSAASAVLLQRRLDEFGTVLAQVSEGAEPDSD